MRGEAASKAVFAANRSIGRIALAVSGESGCTRRTRVYEDGPLRIRFPNATGAALEAVTVNTSGGIAGGDRHAVDITAEHGAILTVTTAAAEKVYRAIDTPAELSLTLSVKSGSKLFWMPQETILFDQAALSRRIDVDLGGDGTVLIAEALVFGRSAMGERVERGLFFDRWRVRRDGRLIFADSVRLDGAIADRLAEPAMLNNGAAFATVVLSPADETLVTQVRETQTRGEVGISAWNGLAVARFCAKDGATLRHDLAAVLAAMAVPVPRIWSN